VYEHGCDEVGEAVRLTSVGDAVSDTGVGVALGVFERHCATLAGRAYEYVAAVEGPFRTAAEAETCVLHNTAPPELSAVNVQPFMLFMASTSEP